MENYFDEKMIFEYLQAHAALQKLFSKLSDSKKRIVKEIIALGQADRIFFSLEEKDFASFNKLLDTLLEVDLCYKDIGGISGYLNKFVSLLKLEQKKDLECSFKQPYVIDISKRTPEVQEYIDTGIVSLSKLAAIFPVGGSGDRLNLIDEKTGEKLSQVKYEFMGKNLIEHLILDLKAREYLYYKLYQEKIITPAVIMTSDAKNNHEHVLDIFKKNNYFGRPVDSFLFIKQISVPLVNEEGNFVIKGKLELELKPGGHGVLWNLMLHHNAFEWLYNKQRTKAIVRQINNMAAAIDYNIFAICGYGIEENKKFGFTSCFRKVQTAEGMNVLKIRKVEGGYEYNHSNIEYTDFQKCGIIDTPTSEGSEYSLYPSNTNTLFIDLKSVEEAAKIDPLPGLTINMKSSCEEQGRKLKAGRLELLMQAIADNFVDFFPNPLSEDRLKELSTFVIHNERRKAISAIKCSCADNCSLTATPIGVFFDIQQNFREVLSDYCKISLPKASSLEDFVKNNPNFICYLNPMLGPMYLDIGKKIRGGRILSGSELWLDIADCEIEKLYLSGSLLIYGSVDNLDKTGRCILRNVKVKNKGIDKTKKNIFHENKICRQETLKIILHENSLFEADDLIFDFPQTIEVCPNQKMRAFSKNGKIIFETKN